HHGDGVMYGFYGRGDVLDIDFHETGEVLFPGTGAVAETGEGDGVGLKVNVPLPPGVGDEAFEPLFQRIVPTMIRSFRPKLIVLQCGVDAHAGDRLGHLQYTPRAYLGAVSTLAALADEVADGRLLVTGGGGYRAQNVALVLARVGVALGGAGNEDALPDGLPTHWREEFETTLGEAAPRSLRVAPALTRSPWNPEREAKLVGALESATGHRFPRRA
ncbi:MAG: hypothetical protein L3J73_02605, partial [Thermoplasmata archaeon]|nr:hypothetical protein [Thermoplasmata archaeon]